VEKSQFFSYIPADLPLPESAPEKLWAAFEIFQEISQKLNLTGMKNDEDRAIKLFIDSLFPLSYFDFSTVRTAADLGTGGGFPGIPLAIALPHVTFTLIDSTRKKVDAVNDMIVQLKLPNATALWARSEVLVEQKKTFDVVFTKAFAPLGPMLNFGLPLTAKGGHLIAFLADAEMVTTPLSGQILKKQYASMDATYHYVLPASAGSRQLAIFQKRR
jgi:16S rRNA (guanine527-N7)-methyltransferase